MNWKILSLAGLVLSLFAYTALTVNEARDGIAHADPIVVAPPQGAPLSFADLIDRVSPAVVSVNVRGERVIENNRSDDFLERFRGFPEFDEFLQRRRDENAEEDEPRTQETRGLGSGFFISADGFIVTNHHVVREATEIQVVMHDGTEHDAELIGTDPDTDLAVLKVNADAEFPYVEFESTEPVRVGDWVIALGNPFGLGGTATAGIVSAKGRAIGGSNYTDFIQIDASINRGNSGGPTFDLNGRVIGVNTQILSPTGGSVGIGFAIPSDLAVKVTNDIIENGGVTRGWLGVIIGDFRPEFAEALGVDNGKGALVANVSDDSPAQKAGLERNDVITALNGEEIEDASQLTRLVADLKVGEEYAFEILRLGEAQTITVTIGKRPSDVSALANTGGNSTPEDPDAEANTDQAAFGVTFQPLDTEMREKMGLDAKDAGLLVEKVSQDSPFADSMRPGFVLLEVNGVSMTSLKALQKAFADATASGRERVLITLHTGRGINFTTIEIPEDAQK